MFSCLAFSPSLSWDYWNPIYISPTTRNINSDNGNFSVPTEHILSITKEKKTRKKSQDVATMWDSEQIVCDAGARVLWNFQDLTYLLVLYNCLPRRRARTRSRATSCTLLKTQAAIWKFYYYNKRSFPLSMAAGVEESSLLCVLFLILLYCQLSHPSPNLILQFIVRIL